MKRNLLKTMTLFALPVLSASILAGCNQPAKTFNVTFYDGKTVLRVVKVEKGQKVEQPTDLETKAGGYKFVDWYATTSKNHLFDFTQEITEDKSVFAGFSLYQLDEREWYVVGSGQGEILAGSAWGTNFGDEFAMAKGTQTDENVYTMTLDLYKDDQFQFAGKDWYHKRGYGYVKNVKIGDKQYFDGTGGGYGDTVSKGQNIKVVEPGNYTFTLKTYPGDDTYNTADASYTEEKKEVYNLGTYDSITWVRNGDAAPLATSVTNWYIKGDKITGWNSLHSSFTKFNKIANKYTLNDVYLKKDDAFMFNSFITNLETNVEGAQMSVINGANGTRSTDFDSVIGLSGNNFVAKADGIYDFEIDVSGDTPKITATYEDSTPELLTHDFYINGTFLSTAWGAVTNTAIDSTYKMTAIPDSTKVVYENLELKAGNQIVVQSMKAGATEGKSNWGIAFKYDCVVLPNEFVQQKASDDTNTMIIADGTYTITFDYYAKSIVITGTLAAAPAAE